MKQKEKKKDDGTEEREGRRKIRRNVNIREKEGVGVGKEVNGDLILFLL